MKITYHASFNLSVPPEVAKDMPLPSMAFKAEGAIDCTQDEYLAALKATVDAAKEAADAWRPVFVDIVKSMFPHSFKGFCVVLWQKAKKMLDVQFGATVEETEESDLEYARR